MKKIIAIFISLMILGCICGCRKISDEIFSNTSSMGYNSSLDSSLFEDVVNSNTTQAIENSTYETTAEATVATPSKSAPTASVSSNEKISEQPTPATPTESTVENTDSNSLKEPSEPGTTTTDEIIEVTIGNRIYSFAPSPYGQCDKCGLPAGMVIPHEDYTCEQCGKTCCNAAFYSSWYDGYVCPFCNYIKEKEPTYCPTCGKIWDNGYNGTCSPYKDPLTNEWVCQQYD